MTEWVNGQCVDLKKIKIGDKARIVDMVNYPIPMIDKELTISEIGKVADYNMSICLHFEENKPQQEFGFYGYKNWGFWSNSIEFLIDNKKGEVK